MTEFIHNLCTIQKKYRKETLPVWTDGNFCGSAKENLAVIVDGKDGFTFRATETAGLCRFKLLRAYRTGENFGENLGFDLDSARLEEIDGIGEGILDIEKLGKAEQLKDLIDLWLDLEKNDIPALRLYCLQKRGKRANTGR